MKLADHWLPPLQPRPMLLAKPCFSGCFSKRPVLFYTYYRASHALSPSYQNPSHFMAAAYAALNHNQREVRFSLYRATNKQPHGQKAMGLFLLQVFESNF